MDLRKQSKSKSLPLLLICLVSSCERFQVDRANQTMRDIRTAESAFREDRGRYGTLKELVDARLLSNSLAAGEDGGSRFQLRTAENAYEAVSVPTEKNDSYQYVGWTFYLNESGIIRGCAYGKANSYVEANKEDRPVRYQ